MPQEKHLLYHKCNPNAGVAVANMIGVAAIKSIYGYFISACIDIIHICIETIRNIKCIRQLNHATRELKARTFPIFTSIEKCTIVTIL